MCIYEMNTVHYKLDDWIGDNEIKLTTLSLSQNPNAIDYIVEKNISLNVFSMSRNTNDLFIRYCLLERFEEHINWDDFSMNSADEAVTYLLRHPDKIRWKSFSCNTNMRVIDFLEKNPEKIDWSSLSGNPSAITLLKKNRDKINYSELSGNTNPEVLELFKNNKKRLNWKKLSSNHVAIDLLLLNKTSIKKIDWLEFNKNRSKKAVDYLIKNPQYIYYYHLSINEYAIDYLKEHMNMIVWERLGYNKGIFKIDYEKMKRKYEIMAEDIYKEAVNPKRICRLLEEYGDEEIYKIYFDE